MWMCLYACDCLIVILMFKITDWTNDWAVPQYPTETIEVRKCKGRNYTLITNHGNIKLTTSSIGSYALIKNNICKLMCRWKFKYACTDILQTKLRLQAHDCLRDWRGWNFNNSKFNCIQQTTHRETKLVFVIFDGNSKVAFPRSLISLHRNH